jgi:xanthine/uracil/vitamin C permease (AzgA family)
MPLNQTMLVKIVDISSMIFLITSIVMFEIGYKKNKAKIFISGFEILVLAIFTLLIKHMPKVLGETMQTYTKIGIGAFIAYYILKIAIIYTKYKQDELKSLSDIKEIVKEEPTKKVAKRKNKKEEGK